MLHALESLRRRCELASKQWIEESRKRKRLTKKQSRGHIQKEEVQEVRRLLNKNVAERTVSKPADNIRILRRQHTTECTISVVYPPNEKVDHQSEEDLTKVTDSHDEPILTKTLLANSVKEEQGLIPADEGRNGPARESERNESPPNAVHAAKKAETNPPSAHSLDSQHKKAKRHERIPPASRPTSGEDVLNIRSSTMHLSATSTALQQTQIPSTEAAVHNNLTAHHTPSHSSTSTPPTLPSESSIFLPLPLSPSNVHPPDLPPRATDFVDSWLHTISSAGDAAGGEWAKLPAQRPYEADQWHAEDLAVGESAGVLEERRGSETGMSSRDERKDWEKEASAEG